MEEEISYLTDGTPEYVKTLFPPMYPGICVDIGAYDPFWINNSWIFEEIGWDTYCIEPNPNCIPRLKKYRKNVLEYACGSENKDNVELFVFSAPNAGPNLKKKEKWKGEAAGTGLSDFRKFNGRSEYHISIYDRTVLVKMRTLDWLMENEIKKDKIDVLSIDVECYELEVLKGISLNRWKPKVIIIEDLTPEDTTQRDYIVSRGYRQVHRISVNDIYLKNDFYDDVMRRA